ncbi:4Fe-4S single cluster domain-containing protein [Metabacillus sp. 113a]|uniref:4Fe-4S single cluster domain-containing protein n=1 Tax=Metabacillus sp. 113a TaxID=3404706 RepID=UPI003CE9F7EC
MLLNLHRFLPLTEAEGPGKRACLWVQGCPIRCEGCGVPWTWSKDGGKETSVDEMYEEIMKSYQVNGIEGVTFLGGEPFEQAAPLAELAKKLKRAGLSIMCFSGYPFETLKAANRKDWDDLISETDLLIDGPFVKSKLDLSRPWVGSSNQHYRFLTNRYSHLEYELHTLPNRLEIRLGQDGRIMVNGMAAPDTIKDLFLDIGKKQSGTPITSKKLRD